MMKQTCRDVAEKIFRYFILGFFIILIVYQFFLPFTKISDAPTAELRTEILQILTVCGAVALLLVVLWVALWLARRKSLRVYLATESLLDGSWKVGGLVFAVLAGLVFFGLGVYYAFDLSHQLTSEWWQIRNQPELDAADIAAASSNTLLAITGFLDGNEPVSSDGYGFVAYTKEEWSVFPCNTEESEDCFLVPGQGTGFWRVVTQGVPGLTLTVSGGTVSTLPVSRVAFGGDFTEWLEIKSNASIAFTADYNGQVIGDGSLRTRGLRNGDLMTVVGHKAITGGIVPSHLIGGGHDQLVAYFRPDARYQVFLRVAGVVMMILSPIGVVYYWLENY